MVLNAQQDKQQQQNQKRETQTETPKPQPAAEKSPAKNAGETLHYAIDWPSGLSLGDAQLTSTLQKTESGASVWNYAFSIDAAVPAYRVTDHYQSQATEDFCSIELTKDYAHGQRHSNEKTTFDRENKTATRKTQGGGSTDISTSSCPQDALTYFAFVRHELSQGSLPPEETVYFGAAYQVRLDYEDSQPVAIGKDSIQADRLRVTVKGPAAEINFEIFCAQDQARTPLLVRIPLALGTFTMELVR